MLMPSETAMPAAGYKCKLPLYCCVLVRDGQERMEAAAREEISEKETQKSAFSPSPAGLCVRTCVSWLVSHRQPWRKGPAARVLVRCLDHHTFSCSVIPHGNPVAVLLLHLQTSSGVVVPQLQEG